jgi:hypothetical protein
MKANKTMIGWELSNYRRRKGKESESRIDLAAHTQVLKQQQQEKQINGRNCYHIPININ